MNKELIASKFFKHLDDTALIGYSDFHQHFNDYIVSITFYPFVFDLQILSVEVLNSDWDIKEQESTQLEEYIQPLLEDYNSRNKESIKQQKQIKEDEKG